MNPAVVKELSKVRKCWMCPGSGHMLFDPKHNLNENSPLPKCPGYRKESLFTHIACYAPVRGSVVGNIDTKLVGPYLNTKRMRGVLQCVSKGWKNVLW